MYFINEIQYKKDGSIVAKPVSTKDNDIAAEKEFCDKKSALLSDHDIASFLLITFTETGAIIDKCHRVLDTVTPANPNSEQNDKTQSEGE